MKNANGQQLYLVQTAEGDYESASIMTGAEIFRMMDMADCHPDELEVDIFRLHGIGETPEECCFRGKWTVKGDPLQMRIMCNGEVIESGWGTDH